MAIKFKMTNRQSLSAAIIIFYLIPFLFFSSYSITLMSQHKSWTLLCLGLLLIVIGTLTLIFLLSYWEESVKENRQIPFLPMQTCFDTNLEKGNKVTSLDSCLNFNQLSTSNKSDNHLVSESTFLPILGRDELVDQLNTIIEHKNQELKKQEEESQHLQIKAQQSTQDFSDYKLFSEEQLKQKQLQMTALQQIIEDQRIEREKLQEQISILDTKVHDLSYEIKTLLTLDEEKSFLSTSSRMIKEDLSQLGHSFEYEEAPYSVLSPPVNHELYALESPVKNSVEAGNLLKKCINIAQKLTGAQYYSNETSRYREYSSSYFAIDQRRLFDNLRSETSALVIVYSQKEHKMLFVNNESKTLLGWSPEKFVSDFLSIMQGGSTDWKKALNHLSTNSETQIRLLVKSKQGQEILMHCHLGIISSGLFRNYIVGVMYPA